MTMQKVTRTQKITLVGVAVLLIALAISVYYPVPSNISVPSEEEMVNREIADSAIIPTRLMIPDIGVDASVEHVGVNAAGNMAVPEKFENVAWYQEGYMPGEAGHAVLAGHLDNGLGLDAIFADLDKLEHGDVFFIENEEGETLAFRVTEKNIYNQDNAPLEKIFGPDDRSKVTLITCNGSWIDALNTYQDRLVITGELVDEYSATPVAGT